MVESKKTTLHIDEGQSGLKVYVPRNKDDQQYIFTNCLSRKLFEWMMKDPVTQISEGANKDGVNATRDILLAPRSRIDTALEDNGIATVNILNVDEDIPEPEPPTTPRIVSEDSSQSSTTGSQEDNEQGIIDTPISSIGSPPPNIQSAIASSRSMHSRLSRPIALREDPFTPSVDSDPFTPARSVDPDWQYTVTLSKVIAAARRSTLPSHGPFGMSQLHANLPNVGDTSDLGLRFTSQIERNCKIGAAGELYVRLHSHQPHPAIC